MATFTKADLATRVLKDLGLIGAEETPTAFDLDWATETVGSEINLLEAKGMTIWNGSEESIPSEYLTPLSRRIGLAVASSYGLTDSATAMMAMREAEKDLRILAAKPATGDAARVEFF